MKTPESVRITRKMGYGRRGNVVHITTFPWRSFCDVKIVALASDDAEGPICEKCLQEYQRHEAILEEHRFRVQAAKAAREAYRPEPTPEPLKKKGRRKGKMQVYYQTPAWREKRQLVLERDGMCCVRCGSADRLQVHHKPGSYELIPDEPLALLETLCLSCHRDEHRKK